ncbi:MAG: hypothetical protein PHC66_04845 [Candidatus Nanoarchaeia archaeon]|nr:hypothetical protein [Candidatus Nanoarchaeia archaeon]MDD5239350.1 hypothetical protein [Candidatus Nanoarchaeia archaeon]
MYNKKAQSALEYLLTYGWAILIVIIVGASLYALGVFNPGTFTGKRVTGFTQFQVIDHKLDDNGEMTLMIGNRLGKAVEVGNVSFEYKNDVCYNATYASSHFTLGPNTELSITEDCTAEWGNLDLRSSYSIIVDIEFDDPDSALTHTDSGTLFGAVEAH